MISNALRRALSVPLPEVPQSKAGSSVVAPLTGRSLERESAACATQGAPTPVPVPAGTSRTSSAPEAACAEDVPKPIDAGRVVLSDHAKALLGAMFAAWPGATINPVPIAWAPPRPPGTHQPSWSDMHDAPVAGDRCTVCRGACWWAERTEPKGWRCRTCVPPDHLPAEAVRTVGTK